MVHVPLVPFPGKNLRLMSAAKLQYRAVFISDLHLGSVSCKADAVQLFLKSLDCEQLYLVGDIMDMWVSKKKGKWRQSHTNVVRTILGKAKYGTTVYLTPGNHDSEFRRMNGVDFGNIFIDHEFVHEMLDGRRLWVVHGDYLDRSVTTLKPLAVLGAWLHEGLSGINVFTNRLRENVGKPPSDFSSKAKKRVKSLISYFTNFQDRIMGDTLHQGYNGVVCGHIHKPAFYVEEETGLMYINTGDWMEHCTALVEHLDGRLELIRWADIAASVVGAPSNEGQASLPLIT